eukprot:6210780-Pleurochrysis_carterae.AAC.3
MRMHAGCLRKRAHQHKKRARMSMRAHARWVPHGASAPTFLSTPSRSPSSIPSATPIIETASTRLLESLAAWPLPTSPQCRTRWPISSSTGRARSTAPAVAAPTMKVSVAASAPTTPPETGASTNSHPAASALAAISRAMAGAIVEQSISRVPAATELKMLSSASQERGLGKSDGQSKAVAIVHESVEV